MIKRTRPLPEKKKIVGNSSCREQNAREKITGSIRHKHNEVVPIKTKRRLKGEKNGRKRTLVKSSPLIFKHNYHPNKYLKNKLN